MEVFKRLNYRVVEHTEYEDKVIHIENVSSDLAQALANIMNREYDSYFISEDMEDE